MKYTYFKYGKSLSNVTFFYTLTENSVHNRLYGQKIMSRNSSHTFFPSVLHCLLYKYIYSSDLLTDLRHLYHECVKPTQTWQKQCAVMVSLGKKNIFLSIRTQCVQLLLPGVRFLSSCPNLTCQER